MIPRLSLWFCFALLAGCSRTLSEGDPSGSDFAARVCADVDLGRLDALSVTGDTSPMGNLRSAGCGGDVAPEVVHVWRAPRDGQWTVDTMGSSFDTVLYLEGEVCAPSGSAVLECSDDIERRLDYGRITFAASEGSVVIIVVDGASASERGGYTLTITPGD